MAALGAWRARGAACRCARAGAPPANKQQQKQQRQQQQRRGFPVHSPFRSVGLYVPVRRLVIGDGDPAKAPLWQRMAAGALSGSLGQLVANPFDVVKVRLQADGRLKALGQEPRYRGTFHA